MLPFIGSHDFFLAKSLIFGKTHTVQNNQLTWIVCDREKINIILSCKITRVNIVVLMKVLISRNLCRSHLNLPKIAFLQIAICLHYR